MDGQLNLPLDRCKTPLERRSAVFYDINTGKWNHKYIRIGAVYRLLRKQVIGKARALELLAERHSPAEMKTLRATVELWQAHSLKHMQA